MLTMKKLEKEIENLKKLIQSKNLQCTNTLTYRLYTKGFMGCYEKDKETIETREILKNKGFHLKETKSETSLGGHWEYEIWEREIGNTLI